MKQTITLNNDTTYTVREELNGTTNEYVSDSLKFSDQAHELVIDFKNQNTTTQLQTLLDFVKNPHSLKTLTVKNAKHDKPGCIGYYYAAALEVYGMECTHNVLDDGFSIEVQERKKDKKPYRPAHHPDHDIMPRPGNTGNTESDTTVTHNTTKSSILLRQALIQTGIVIASVGVGVGVAFACSSALPAVGAAFAVFIAAEVINLLIELIVARHNVKLEAMRYMDA